MLTITNGVDTLQVTKGAYKVLYRHQGFRILGKELLSGHHTDKAAEMPYTGDEDGAVTYPDEENMVKSSPENHTNSEPEEDEEEDLSEIPLTEMTKTQLIKYAEQLGIDFDGTETRKDLRIAIRKALNSQR